MPLPRYLSPDAAPYTSPKLGVETRGKAYRLLCSLGCLGDWRTSMRAVMADVRNHAQQHAADGDAIAAD
jgi:hypothetical protein